MVWSGCIAGEAGLPLFAAAANGRAMRQLPQQE
jgi:hypothetical protein